jgi:hypothetical protein
VHIAFLIVALNGLDVLAGDVQNAYINAESKETLYIEEAGPEFSPRFCWKTMHDCQSLIWTEAFWGMMA